MVCGACCSAGIWRTLAQGLPHGEQSRREAGFCGGGCLEKRRFLGVEVNMLNTFPPRELVLQGGINKLINYFNRS